ncbi:MAG: N-acetylmuramoyl-L-alanine amidase [Deltaproteobacteria bacterium]|nr:N-acetylmuramoyl-L-alanine amidase [Deltaproteobacteria bacterium]
MTSLKNAWKLACLSVITFLVMPCLSPANGKEPAAAKPLVMEIKHTSNPEYSRIVISLSAKAAFSHRLLKKDPAINKPRRLFIDIAGAVMDKGLQREITINDGLLKAARAGQFDKETVRVVLDIESIEDYKIIPFEDPFRIVIDVTGEKAKNAQAGPSAAKAVPATEKPQKSVEAKPAAKARVEPSQRTVTIVIDPGHGGKDPGAVGKDGLMEKDVTLKISRMLRKRLGRGASGAKIIMTRDTDVFIPLEERTAIANSRNADLFVSVHINSSPRRAASGVETYILSISRDESARRLAARENATSRKAVSDLEFILSDLMKTAKRNDSVLFASAVHERLVARLRGNYTGIRSNGVKGASFYVLVGTRMPSILVEVSFISNPMEEKRMRSENYLENVVEGISTGILNYINGAALKGGA